MLTAIVLGAAGPLAIIIGMFLGARLVQGRKNGPELTEVLTLVRDFTQLPGRTCTCGKSKRRN